MDTYGTIAYYLEGNERFWCTDCVAHGLYDGTEELWKINQEDMDKMFVEDIYICDECGKAVN